MFGFIADVIDVVTIPVDIVEDVLDLESADLDVGSTIRDEITDSLRDLDE